MSAPVDVRGILARIAITNAQFATTADRDQMVRVGETMLKKQAADLQSVLDAVTELIAADTAYDSARAAWLADCSKHDAFVAARVAWDRRAAVLDRVQGGAQ
ncbi:hypothetical protein [Stenotrophomonas geniculata]|uniref:hypothetical protein n=1 Tax=Stenotrophomonas geniculata TaxID=86188 RepID=UPI0024783F41|nr:hypothetical protein [Stenotrophomonas geniculata]MDH7551844.1 hypothetical protein [Stenotrophomonas geniculata]